MNMQKRTVLIGCAAIAAAVMLFAGCASAQDEAKDRDRYLAQSLFTADFDRNYVLLQGLVSDVAQCIGTEDYAAVQSKVSVVEENLTGILFLHHVCDIWTEEDGTPFFPEDVREALARYYESYGGFVQALSRCLQSGAPLSQETQDALSHLSETLPWNTPYAIKHELFDPEKYGEALEQMNTITDALDAATAQLEQEYAARGA